MKRIPIAAILALAGVSAWLLAQQGETVAKASGGPSVQVDKEVVVLDATECSEIFEARLSVSGFRPDVPADVMLVFDRSGSMNDGGDGCTDPRFGDQESCEANGGAWGPQPITTAREAAKLFIDALGIDDRVGLVSYGSSATLSHELTADRASVKLALDGLAASSFTNIADALDVAHFELLSNGRPEALPIIVLLSDGVANRDILTECDADGCGVYPCEPTCCSQNAIDVATAAKGDGIYVFSIFLPNVDQADTGCTVEDVELHAADTLMAIASGEDFFSMPEAPEELAFVYEFIATQIPPAATELEVVDELAPEFEILPDSIDPAPASVDGNVIRWTLDLLGDETRNYSYRLRRSVDDLPPDEYGTSVEAFVDLVEWNGETARLDFPPTSVELSGEHCGADCLGQGRASLLGKGQRGIGSDVKLKLAGPPEARYRLWRARSADPVLIPGIGVVCLDFRGNRELLSQGRLNRHGFRSIWTEIPDDPELVGNPLTFQFAAEDENAPDGVAVSNAMTFDVGSAGVVGEPCDGGVRSLELFGVNRYDGAFPVDVTIRAFPAGVEGSPIGEVTFPFDPTAPPGMPMVAPSGGLALLEIDAYPSVCLAHVSLVGCGLDGDRLPDTTTLRITVGDTTIERTIDTSCGSPLGTGTRLAPFYVTSMTDVGSGPCD